MMALTQENVHYTLNSGPDVMNKSNRVHARIQGRGGVEARRPENSLDNVFFTVYRVDPMVLLQREEGDFFQGVGRCPKKPI